MHVCFDKMQHPLKHFCLHQKENGVVHKLFSIGQTVCSDEDTQSKGRRSKGREMHTEFGWENLKEDLGVDRIILK